MSEQRLIAVSPENIFRLDADTYPDRMYACGWNGMVHVIEELPTINPETLPIVQELREKLSRYERATNTENIYYMFTDVECPAWFYDNEQTLKIAKYLSKKLQGKGEAAEATLKERENDGI